MNGGAGLGFTRHTRTVGVRRREQVESSGAARPLNAGRTGRMGAGARADQSSVCNGHLYCERTGPEAGEPTPKGNIPFVCECRSAPTTLPSRNCSRIFQRKFLWIELLSVGRRNTGRRLPEGRGPRSAGGRAIIPTWVNGVVAPQVAGVRGGCRSLGAHGFSTRPASSTSCHVRGCAVPTSLDCSTATGCPSRSMNADRVCTGAAATVRPRSGPTPKRTSRTSRGGGLLPMPPEPCPTGLSFGSRCRKVRKSSSCAMTEPMLIMFVVVTPMARLRSWKNTASAGTPNSG